MANWWDWLTGAAGGGGMSSVSGKVQPSPATMARARGTFQPAPPSMARARATFQPGETTSTKYVAPSTAAAAVSPTPNAQRRTLDEILSGAQVAPEVPQGPSAEEQAQDWIAQMLGLAYGNQGGADLSGFQGLIEDVNARRDALNIRKWQQRQFLEDLFDAAGVRAAADRDAIAAAVSGQLETDAARRAEEIALVRGEEAARRQTADLARGALGVTPGPDLSTDVAQNVVGGIGAAGSIADRDARIRQAIAEQQAAREISALVPMEAMSVGQLMSGYEDRLAALASERAGIKAQMAQARAAARGGGPSINELLALQEAANQQFGLSGEAPEYKGILGATQQIQSAFGPAANEIIGIANRILTSTATDQFTGKPLTPQQSLANLVANDPGIASFLQGYPEAAPVIINYVTQASK